MELVKVNYKNIKSVILVDRHIDLINMCGAYATAKYLKKKNFSIDYALACLFQSKYGVKSCQKL